MRVRADLHNHFSTYENYGNVFNEAMFVAQKNLGIDGIFGVINAQDNGIGRYETFLKQGGKKVEDLGNVFFVPSKGIYVVKGQEVFTDREGHLLVLGLNHGVKLKDFRSLEDSVKEAKDNNGIIIADHPFFLDGILTKIKRRKHSIDFNCFDGIEIHNGEAWIPIPGYNDANKEAQGYFNLIKNHSYFDHLGAISSSDGHSVKEIGMSYTVLEKPDFSSPEKLVDSLRKSIREHKDWKEDRQKNSYRGALSHGFGVLKLRLKARVGLIGRVN
tara:strand:- start:207 stop:1022 length:816 start_codon:yes stop_codon:yes gene_type:complete